jgi:acyl-CoA synthetase (NDP forming)
VSEPLSRARAFAVDGNRTAVPEPDVKAALRAAGVSVPRGTDADTPAELVAAARGAGLHAPVALKAFGAGVVHKTDLGAVRLGLSLDDLEPAATAMGTQLASRGIDHPSFLVEEQADTDAGVEVIAGVVRREPFGLVVALGLGGTLTELLDLVSVRMFPLYERDARALVDGFPGAAALAGFRGVAALDRDALVALLLALAGPDGLAAALGDELAELECNPVLVTAHGAVALDARLVLRRPPPVPEPPPPTDFTRLFAPRALAVAGASTTRSTFGNRALAAYRNAGWTGGLYALHPEATDVDGVPAVADVGAVDGPVDYLLVGVPAARCADVIRATAGRVPFVHVISGGFDEVGADGAALSQGLVAAAREVKTRVVGPNCIGVYSSAGRQTFQLNAPSAVGHVSVVSQSGGLAGDLIMGGARRGVRYSKVLSAGNAVDVTPAEVVEWLVDDPDTAVIGLYLEGASGAARLVDALHRARGRKPVVLLVGGRSDQGAEAVASHTGSLTGEARVWDAIAASTDTTLVTTLEEFLAVLAHLQRWAGVAEAGPGDHRGVLVMGVGGGASVLATDACDRAGLVLTPTTGEVRDELRGMGLGAGTSVANPLEIPFGPAAAVEFLGAVLTPILERQPYANVLVHVNTSVYYSYGTGDIGPLIDQLANLASAPLGGADLGVVLRNLDFVPGADADRVLAATAELDLATFRNLDEGALAVAALARFEAARAAAATEGTSA